MEETTQRPLQYGHPTPLEARVVTVLGYRMRYLTAGEGEPVLLLHGLADCAESWVRILPSLARHYQVFALDLLGCGGSDKPRIDYSLWALATYVRHFMDAVDIPQAHIVGHSFGGGLALHLHFQYPERLKRLALIATGGMGTDLSLSLRLCTLPGASPVIGALLASRQAEHPIARVGRAALNRLWPAALVAARAPTDGAASAAADDEALFASEEADILERLRDADARAAFLAMLRGVGNVRGQRATALDRLHLVRTPVLLIHGRNDATIPVAHGHIASKALAQAQLEVIEQCGHCPHREAPTQVSHLLERFFG
ncbi:MAG: alpha/beta fold hydrolase [Ktedonobacterales bacterium]|nr:alpha/beta fold hydrolase [Ktedonobacterales bacterium]